MAKKTDDKDLFGMDLTETRVMISGVDYSKRLHKYFRDSSKRVQDPNNKKKYLFEFVHKKSKVNFDISLLQGDNIGQSSVLPVVNGAFMDMKVAYNDQVYSLVDKFREANVLFFSGHHYSANYYTDRHGNLDDSHNYYCPGLSSSCETYSMGRRMSCQPGLSLEQLMLYNSSSPDVIPPSKEPVATSSLTPIIKPLHNVRIFMAVGCNYLRPNVLYLYQKLFPDAVILAYYGKGPGGSPDQVLINYFFNNFDWDNMFDKKEIIRVWKEAIIKYPKMARHKPGYFCYDDVHGKWVGEYFAPTNTDPGYFAELPHPDETVVRLMQYDRGLSLDSVAKKVPSQENSIIRH